MPRFAIITKPVTRTHAGTGCAQKWRRVKKAESILPEDKHVWMQGNKSNLLHQATNMLCHRNGIAHQKDLANGWRGCDNETGCHRDTWCFILRCKQRTPWTSKVDRPGNELPMSKQKIWRITSRWMQMKVRRHSHKRRESLQMGGDQESSVQEESRGKTILAFWSVSVRQVEIAIDRELESHDTER